MSLRETLNTLRRRPCRALRGESPGRTLPSPLTERQPGRGRVMPALRGLLSEAAWAVLGDVLGATALVVILVGSLVLGGAG